EDPHAGFTLCVMEFRQQHQQQPCPSRHAEPSGLQQGESKRQPVAELQIVNIDYHMTSPTSVDCTPRPPYNVFEEPLKQVPVIRIFGTTRGQQRMCLHVHQVWPYLYVRYDGEASIEAVRGFGYQLGVGLNHALNVSLKSVGSLFVVAVVPVKGVPFYGFCAGYRPFLKIFLANPDMLLRASTLLAAGAVMSKKHEIFESHLSYVMQFMVDYNLYGVEWIRLDRLLFRSPLPMPVPFAGQHPLRIADDTVHAEHRWIPQGMPSYLVNPAPPDRVCHCELEADATAADIANRQQVRERAIHHVLSEGQLDVQFGRLVHSLDRIWIDENRRRAQHGLDLLQLKHSQLPTDATQLTDHEPSTQIRGRGFQWSSHWRMHSLFQSALADDRRKYRQQVGFKLGNPARDMLDADCSMSSNADVDEAIDLESFNSDSAWISAWPTCRQVDVGDMPLISCRSLN
ncbi:DNA polymerase zeta, partial [Coemansia thaxteri]